MHTCLEEGGAALAGCLRLEGLSLSGILHKSSSFCAHLIALMLYGHRGVRQGQAWAQGAVRLQDCILTDQSHLFTTLSFAFLNKTRQAFQLH